MRQPRPLTFAIRSLDLRIRHALSLERIAQLADQVFRLTS